MSDLGGRQLGIPVDTPINRPRPGGLIAKLRRARMERGIVQSVLAVDIGVQRNRLVAWECGNNVPTLFLLQAWANALGYDFKLVERT